MNGQDNDNATIGYGFWNSSSGTGTDSIDDLVHKLLGEFVHEFDVDAIIDDFAQAIDAALPEGLSLHGGNFYAAYYPHHRGWDGDLDIAAIIESVDPWEIIPKHAI